MSTRSLVIHNVCVGVATAFILLVIRSAPVSAEEQTTVAHNGDATLRVFSEGSGQAIVLLPGQGRGPRDLDAVTRFLVSAGYRVIRPEPRGFGESVGSTEGVTLHDNAADVVAALERRIFGANNFRPFVKTARINAGPIGYGRRPGHCKDAFILDRELEL
jgi:hypothetical protein